MYISKSIDKRKSNAIPLADNSRSISNESFRDYRVSARHGHRMKFLLDMDAYIIRLQVRIHAGYNIVLTDGVISQPLKMWRREKRNKDTTVTARESSDLIADSCIRIFMPYFYRNVEQACPFDARLGVRQWNVKR